MTLRALGLSFALLTFVALPAAADPSGTWRMSADMRPRRNFTATVLDSGEVLVAGGNMSPTSHTGAGSCLIYDPLTDHWRQAAGMPSGRARHSAIKLRSGKVLIAGGTRNSGKVLDPNRSAVLYDPASDSWEVLPEPSYWAVNRVAAKPLMALLADGRVLAMNERTSRDMRIFDPATKTWITDYLNPLIRAWRLRTGVASAQLTGLPDGRVFVAMTAGHTWPTKGSAFMFDPNATPIAQARGRVYPYRLVAGPKGEIVGAERDDSALYVERKHSSWMSHTALTGLRYNVSKLERLPSGRIVAFNSAFHNSDGDGRRFEVNLLDLKASKPAWRKLGRRGGAVRWSHQYVVLKSGEIMLLGGFDAANKPLPTYVLTISDEAARIRALKGSTPPTGSSGGIAGGLTPQAPSKPAAPAAPSKPKVDKARIKGGQLQIEGEGFAGSDVRVYLGRQRLWVSRQEGGTKIVAALPAAAMTTSVRVRVDGRLSAGVRLAHLANAPVLRRAWRAGQVLVIEGSRFGSSVQDVRAFLGKRSLRVLWATPTRLVIERPSVGGRLQIEVKGLRSVAKTLR